MPIKKPTDLENKYSTGFRAQFEAAVVGVMAGAAVASCGGGLFPGILIGCSSGVVLGKISSGLGEVLRKYPFYFAAYIFTKNGMMSTLQQDTVEIQKVERMPAQPRPLPPK